MTKLGPAGKGSRPHSPHTAQKLEEEEKRWFTAVQMKDDSWNRNPSLRLFTLLALPALPAPSCPCSRCVGLTSICKWNNLSGSGRKHCGRGIGGAKMIGKHRLEIQQLKKKENKWDINSSVSPRPTVWFGLFFGEEIVEGVTCLSSRIYIPFLLYLFSICYKVGRQRRATNPEGKVPKAAAIKQRLGTT